MNKEVDKIFLKQFLAAKKDQIEKIKKIEKENKKEKDS